MLKAEYVSNDIFKFKNSIIFKFIILGVAGFVAGYFLIQIGLDGEWRELNEDTIPLAIGILAFAGGITSFIFGPQIHTFLFDKNKNKIIYTRKKLTGTINDSYPLDEVKKIVITQKRTKSSGDNKKKIIYHYNLQFDDEDLIKLYDKQRNNSSFSRLKDAHIPDEINELSDFLDLEIESKGLKESIGEMINTVSSMISKSREEKKD